MSSIIRGTDGLDSSNIATDTELVNGLALKANTADLKEIGVGQTWTDVTASRASGVTYTNTTGKPIMVAVTSSRSSSTVQASVNISINGVYVQGNRMQTTTTNSQAQSICSVVPSGATYVVTVEYTSMTWSELR